MMVGSGWRVAWLWLLFAGTPACARAQTFEEAAALHQAGKLADAERAYRAVIRRGGAGAEVWANLGALLARQDRFDEAVEAYRKALEMAPQLAKVRLNLGLAYFKADRFEPAGQEFSAYLAADPGNRQALQLRAMCALEMEKFEDAVAGYLALMPTADL